MRFNTYGGNGAQLAAALASITEFTAQNLGRVLDAEGVKDCRVSAGQVAPLRQWCLRLRPVFSSDAEERHVALVNGLLADGTARIHIATHDGHPPHLHYQGERDDLLSRVRAVTAGGLAVAVCGAGGGRLGRCARTGCVTCFVDTSRNGRRRFCSVACANRVNVARHRARAAGGPRTPPGPRR